MSESNLLVYVYKSPKRAETYLYIKRRDDFSAVPKALLETFGRPQFVMVFALHKRHGLGQVDIAKLKQELEEKGFYLQLPPPPENLLKQHLQNQTNHKG